MADVTVEGTFTADNPAALALNENQKVWQGNFVRKLRAGEGGRKVEDCPGPCIAPAEGQDQGLK